MTRAEIATIRTKLAETAEKAKMYAERIRSRSEKDMRYDNNDRDYFYIQYYKAQMYALRELAESLGLNTEIGDDFSVVVKVKQNEFEDFHIFMETKEGLSKWLETESTGERTIIFESFYNKEGDCASEEIVGWIWGSGFDKEDIKDYAEKRNLKATYRL